MFSFCSEDHAFLLCSQMGIWKINSQSWKISWHRTTWQAPCQFAKFKLSSEKKSPVLKIISFQEIWTQLMAFSNEPQFEKTLMRAEEQNRWQVFKQEVYNVINEGCNLSGHYMLFAEDWFTHKGNWLSGVPWSINNVCNHEEFSPHMVGADAVVSSWGLWWF